MWSGSSPAALLLRLRGRREEIEEATLTRVFAVSELPDRGGPEYAEGLRAAVAAGIEHGIAGLERGECEGPEVPNPLLAQARLAARSGVGLDTVLRRYVAGHALLTDFVLQEAEGELLPAELKRLLRRLAAVVDRVAAAVSDAYRQEAERHPDSAERRRAELVERLLAGELVEVSGLAYDLDGIHLGMIAVGPGALEAMEGIARSLGCRLLTVPREERTVWAWLGGRHPLDPEELRLVLLASWPPRATLALGEPGEGPDGWCLTHRQARAALPVAVRSPEPFVRYVDVALLASILHDDLLVTSLRRLYLEPLEEERDGGVTLRATLRAYFACERNVSSAAAALGVSRPTVRNRLLAIERRIGRSPGTCAAELEAALSFAELAPSPARRSAT